MKSVQHLSAAALLLAATAACGAATAQTQTPPPSAPSTGTGVQTRADVAFMQGMIAHHGQALEMTRLVPTHTENTQIRLLARRIDVSQQDEMATMRRWLQDRGEAVPAANAAHAGHDMAGMQHDSSAMRHEMMPGMLTPQEMAQLAAASGADFDRLFLTFMIKHHEGALTMVSQLLASPGAAQQSDTFAFANDVDADQRAEIARMQRLLAVFTATPPAPPAAPTQP